MNNKFNYYIDTYHLNSYENLTHSPPDCLGNREAADVAGKLYARWCGFYRLEEQANHTDETLNALTATAYQVYEEFMDMIRDANRAYNEFDRILIVEPIYTSGVLAATGD